MAYRRAISRRRHLTSLHTARPRRRCDRPRLYTVGGWAV
jgi:hypothetical protein